MKLFHKEKQESKDALEQLQVELDAETADEAGTEASNKDAELSLVEKLALEAEEEIRMEKLALEAEEEIRMEKLAGEMDAVAESVEADGSGARETMADVVEDVEAEDSVAGDFVAETSETENAELDNSEAEEYVTENFGTEDFGTEDFGTEDSDADRFETESFETKNIVAEESRTKEADNALATDLRLLRRIELADKIRPYRRYLIGAAALLIGLFLILWGVSKSNSVSGDIEETESTELPIGERTISAISYTPTPRVSEGEKPDTAYMSYQDMQDSLRGWIGEFGKINIRDKADFEGKIIDYVVYGDQVTVFEQEGEFTRIKYVSSVTGETVEGYCFSEYISRTEPEGPQVYLNVPLYKQADQRWGAVKIGSYETLASAGCTTTCISMVESYMNGRDIFPNEVKETLYYTYDGRLVFPDYYVHHWARDYMTVAVQKLRQGIPVLVSGYNAAGGTHWVVLVAYKGDGVDLSSDLFLINDPGSPRTTLTDFMRDYPFIEKIVYYNK